MNTLSKEWLRQVENSTITDIFPMHFSTLKATFCIERNTPNYSHYGFVYKKGKTKNKSGITMFDGYSI